LIATASPSPSLPTSGRKSGPYASQRAHGWQPSRDCCGAKSSTSKYTRRRKAPPGRMLPHNTSKSLTRKRAWSFHCHRGPPDHCPRSRGHRHHRAAVPSRTAVGLERHPETAAVRFSKISKTGFFWFIAERVCSSYTRLFPRSLEESLFVWRGQSGLQISSVDGNSTLGASLHLVSPPTT
jgi:hypothetical protein